MSSEERLELSVEETNQLRAELGLAPLRGTGATSGGGGGGGGATAKASAFEGNHHNNSNAMDVDDNTNSNSSSKAQDDKEVLEMSVDETNKLREKLGLPPLRDVTSVVQDVDLAKKQKQEEEAQWEEKEQLKEDVERGIESTFTAKSLGEEPSHDVSSWAAKLRKTGATAKTTATGKDKKQKKTSKKKKSKKGGSGDDDKYDESDLKGMAVSHAASELEAGSTTVMTLADAPLLETNEHNARIVTGLNEDANTPQLENINLAEAAKQSDGLKKKRQLEMGLGRAGGYAGYDDDEFEELGGTGAPSRRGRADTAGGAGGGAAPKGGRRGFHIGSIDDEERGGNDGSDLFAMENGKAISLEPSQADVQASDFMTEQEDLELRGKDKKKSKKKDKFDKKKKRKDKKEKRKHRRRQEEDNEESEDEVVAKIAPAGTKTLLQELEETADDKTSGTNGRKRHRGDDDAENAAEESPACAPSASILSKVAKKDNKRAKYDAIMDKGNARTQQAFSEKKNTVDEEEILDEEPDDAFLNAAMAKARRLKKLRGMNGGSSGAPVASGAAAVAAAVSAQAVPDGAPSSGTTNGGITFSVDDTREFTRALQARSEQQSRKQAKVDAQKNTPANTISTVKKAKEETAVETVKQEDDNGGDDDIAMEDMEELAKEIKDDGNNTGSFLDGTTGNTVSVGRGLAGVLNLFQQTGELTRKNAGKEELRGRAKDRRNYEDYEKLDLKTVVKIDDRYATDKDREFAAREVKLEYRDKHGRLLTTKEAYRDLCYQFHGHGSSKKNEERRQKQMARDQAEGRMASQQLGGADGGPGMLGALKATQKATGKAFVVHKTGN